MLGIRLDPETDQGLRELARLTHRSKSEIAREAIAKYVRGHHGSLVAEARRQSRNAKDRGWTEEDAYWESIAASDDFEASPPGKDQE